MAYSVTMDEPFTAQRAIRDKWTLLCDTLQFDSIKGLLIEEHVIEPHQKESIDSKTCDYNKIDAVLDILIRNLRNRPDLFSKFLTILTKIGKHQIRNELEQSYKNLTSRRNLSPGT